MNRRDFLALTGAAAAFPRVALAQQTKVPRIAILGLPLLKERLDAIRQGLADHGYDDSKNVTVHAFFAPTTSDIAAYAAMAVAAKPDIILCTTTPATQSAMALTSAIPIVMIGINDPVGNGLIASLAHPGGNVTGNTLTTPDVVGKQLGILKELVPTMRRMAVLDLPADPSTALIVAQIRSAAQALNIQPVVLDFDEAQDFNIQLERVAMADVQAFFLTANTYFNIRDELLYQFELRTKLPRWGNLSAVPFRGVVAYGANTVALHRQSGDYVDAILKGSKPADLPVAQPTVFDLAVNTSTAKAIGLTIPSSILAQATQVIE